MSRLLKIVFVVVIAAIVVSLAAFIYVRRRNQLARLTAEAPAQVLSVSVEADRPSSAANRSRTKYKTLIVYNYTVNGAALRGQTSKSGDVKSVYENGQRVKVCYEPEHPKNSEIFAADHKCGG